MKKFMCILFSLACAVSSVSFLGGCGGARSELLRVYVPGEYLDPEVYESFADWYREKTGKTICVKETTFDTNESMLLKIEKSKKDYDLVCPSDYMIQHMMRKNLLLPVDKSIVDIAAEGENGQPLIKQTYIDITRAFDDTLTYTVPYMYGTFGIMYDYSKTGEHLNSWEYMFFRDDAAAGGKYRGKLTQKESVREMYVSACIYDKRKELSELSDGFTNYTPAFNARLQQIYEDTSLSTIKRAKRLLSAQKKYILKYEGDDGKFGIAGGTLRAVGGLYWSCDAGYVMGDYEDSDGNTLSGNKNLWYAIPKEGGNVYIDGFVIPKYAGNVTAANLFLQYLCTQEIAEQNSYYAGAISPVSTAYDALYESYSTDDEFFEGTADGWKEMYLDMLFPSDHTLLRCGVMKDFVTNNSEVNLMFADIVG